jgi:hypothetical protein
VPTSLPRGTPRAHRHPMWMAPPGHCTIPRRSLGASSPSRRVFQTPRASNGDCTVLARAVNPSEAFITPTGLPRRVFHLDETSQWGAASSPQMKLTFN